MVDGEGCRTDIKWFSENTSIPIVIKGVQTGGWELVQSAPIARYLYVALDTCATSARYLYVALDTCATSVRYLYVLDT